MSDFDLNLMRVRPTWQEAYAVAAAWALPLFVLVAIVATLYA
jgi:hypothetical protein